MAGQRQEEDGETAEGRARQERAQPGRQLREGEAGIAKTGRGHGTDPLACGRYSTVDANCHRVRFLAMTGVTRTGELAKTALTRSIYAQLFKRRFMARLRCNCGKCEVSRKSAAFAQTT